MIRERLAENWWVFVVRGVLAILFGFSAFVMPGMTLAGLILLYAVYALGDGIVASVAALTRRTPGGAFLWPVLLIGLASIAAGIAVFMYPGLTALLLLYMIGAWCIVRGIFEIIVGFQLRNELRGEGWLIASGALSVLFGLIVCARPGAGAMAVLWMIGAFAVLFGVINIALGFKLKSFKSAQA